MIDYQTYCQIRHLFVEKRLGLRQIARQLKLGLNTVRKWARRQSYPEATPALGPENRTGQTQLDPVIPGRCNPARPSSKHWQRPKIRH